MDDSTFFSSETSVRNVNFNIIKYNKSCQDILVSLKSLECFYVILKIYQLAGI